MTDTCNECHEGKEPYTNGAFGFLCLGRTIKILKRNILDCTGSIAQMEYRLEKAMEASDE